MQGPHFNINEILKGVILMFKKTISYVDFDGNERTEDFYFNLTKAELTEMEFGTDGGLTKTLLNIIATNDEKRLVEHFKKIIQKSYGVKSLDGRRFIKTPEVIDEFMQTEAYSIFFMELANDAEAATAFINGILPVVPTDAQNKTQITPNKPIN